MAQLWIEVAQFVRLKIEGSRVVACGVILNESHIGSSACICVYSLNKSP